MIVSVNGCQFLCVSPATDRQPIQGVHRLSVYDSSPLLTMNWISRRRSMDRSMFIIRYIHYMFTIQ